MIQKEEIQHRRSEIAEIRHADSVYRDIQARENEREDYEKRWFWELLQNAKDSINESEKIKVKIEISDNEVSFSHTGNPFELDDILSLIIQGSSKNNIEGKTGRFGTGFMTTYLLSKEVRISGKLTENKGCFEFLLNRNAISNEDFYKNQLISNDHFDNSIQENSYLGDSEFQTKFTYNLDTKGRQTAVIGLECLDELIPLTQLFNEQITSVIVIEKSIERTFSKSFIDEHQVNESKIKEWQLNTFLNNKIEKEYKAYVLHNDDYESCIITQTKDEIESIFQLTNSFPRLYFTFPLIGTEEIGIPIIINSTKFDPRIERDGVYLRKTTDNNDETINKTIIHQALLNSSISFASLFSKKSVSGIFELFNFKISKDLKWIDHDWLKKIKNEALNELSTLSIIKFHNSHETVTSLQNLTIPYTNNPIYIDRLWILLSNIEEFKIPLKYELDKWVKIAENITSLSENENEVYKLSFVSGIKNLIFFVENMKNIENFIKSLNTDVSNWLGSFYSLINEIYGSLPLDKSIIVNQDDFFCNGEGMYWDKSNDEELVAISKLLKINFAQKLISKIIKPFHIVGIDNFTKQDAINEVKTNINDLDDDELLEIEFLHSNARFLKWLIINNSKDTIRDLKIITGTSKKNDETYVFDLFPKTDHLLLPPKVFFEINFPLYANIIRDKDCLNEVYNNFLTTEDFQFLENNGFIHFSPLVLKNEFAERRILELLVLNESDLDCLKDNDGQIIHKVKLEFSDFAYLTATGGHIYDRNSTQKSSLERFKFLLLEAVEKDGYFENDIQEISIEGIEKPILFHKCLWVYRAKKLPWIYIKSESETTDAKFINETPSSKNLSLLIKEEDYLIKAIRGSRQQLLLNKLGVGVSDLIRNALPSDELRLSWDKAITNMITSDIDPELVQAIFNDPHIRKEYEKRINQRNLINRNQTIGKLIEDLFQELILKKQEKGYLINIKREPFGSDYIITDESSDLVNNDNQREAFKINDWLIELKATGKDHAAMTPLQAKTATDCRENYALIVVPLDGSEPDLDYIKQNAKIIKKIGHKIGNIITDFNEVELKKSSLNTGKDGISVNIEDQNIRFRVSSDIWQSAEVESIENFIEINFVKLIIEQNETTDTNII
jgi:hypothetical protein